MERRTGSRSQGFGPVSRALVLAVCTLVAGWAAPARAASSFRPTEAVKPGTGAPAAAPAGPQQPAQADRLVVNARQLIYDKDHDTVTAEGDVQLYYQGRVLQADKVIYDRKTSRVFAEGNAKLTEVDGTVAYGDRFDLTDDFKTGFIDSLSAVTKDKTYFTAPRVEREAGNTSVFDKGTYTACEPCKDHPERPPTWQIKAARIIHDKQEQTVYFEDATFELLGTPIAYVPYFSAPDPSVTRKSGFLAPSYVYESRLGVGAAIPYFFALAPNYDLTITPTLLSNQGLLGQVEWRQRTINGSYNIRLTGIDQANPGVFPDEPYGTGNRRLRGSLESVGKFYINEQWKYGWDISLFSDKYFFQNYKIRSESLTSDYIKESISTAYLTGQGDRSFFDLRGYVIKGLSEYDFNKQQPQVAVLDYNRTLPVTPESSLGIGGEIKIDSNFTAISRTAADYQSTGVRLLDQAFALYDVCPTSLTPNPSLPNFKPPNCFVRGIGGTYDRATAQVSWQRKIIDPFGEVWTPFAFVRANGSWLSLNETSSYTFSSPDGVSVISNGDQANFFGGGRNDSFYGSVMPGVGLTWRYPFIDVTPWGTEVVEPIVQVIARTNEAHAGRLPNEDAQSLVFDDTTLFEWSKFSGYDRQEGGVRANAGAQYTMTFRSGASVNALFGESFQLAGLNSYSVSDVANVASESGLETRRSDYVARVAVNASPDLSFIARGRFSEKDFNPESIDIIANGRLGGASGSIQYSRYAAQDLIGYPYRREGVLFTARYDLLDHYFLRGTATLDLNPHKYNPGDGLYDLKTNGPALAVLGAGLGYEDDCTTVSLNYTRSYTDSYGVQSVDQTVLLQFTLRTLANTKLQTGLGAQTVQDGIYR